MLPRNLAQGTWILGQCQSTAQCRALWFHSISRTYIHSIIRSHHFPHKKSPSLFYDILMILWLTMGIQWYLKQFRKDIGRFLQEICYSRHLCGTEIPSVRGNSRAATSRPHSSGAMSPSVFLPQIRGCLRNFCYLGFFQVKNSCTVQPNSSHSSWT